MGISLNVDIVRGDGGTGDWGPVAVLYPVAFVVALGVLVFLGLLEVREPVIEGLDDVVVVFPYNTDVVFAVGNNS